MKAFVLFLLFTQAYASLQVTSVSNPGTVTSVAETVPTFLSIAGSPITSSGTLAITLSGTALPVTSGGTGATGLTQYGLAVWAAGSAMTNVAPGAAGEMLQGAASANPAFTSSPSLGTASSGGSLGLYSTTSGGSKVTVQNERAASGYNFNLPTTAGAAGTVLTSQGGGSTDMTWSSVLTNPASAAYDMLYQNAGNTAMTNLANGTTGQLLKATTSGAPSWGQASLTANVSGILPVANGGTGLGTLTAHAIQVGNGTSTPTQLGPDSSSVKWLKAAGSSADPAFTAFTAPTIQNLTATGSATGWLFTVSAWVGTLAVGDTYTNNSNTYTVLGAQTNGTGQTLFMSGTGTTSGGTLTKSVSAAGPATMTFSSKVALATYTTPANTLYVKIKMVGGGGGGGGAGSTCTVAAVGGLDSFFGANILHSNGGGAGTNKTAGVGGGSGGISSVGSPAIGVAIAGANGCDSGTNGSTSVFAGGSCGGSTAYFSGAGGAGGANANGHGGSANTGAGGGGAGGPASATTGLPGSGGGGSGFVDAIISSPAATYPYVIGTGGVGGTCASFNGGGGADGHLIVEEYYQ